MCKHTSASSCSSASSATARPSVLTSQRLSRSKGRQSTSGLYGQSTNRVLVFTNVTRGEGVGIALRVLNPTPNAVILHGLEEDELWEHAQQLARIDGYALATTTVPLEDLLERLGSLE